MTEQTSTSISDATRDAMRQAEVEFKAIYEELDDRAQLFAFDACQRLYVSHLRLLGEREALLDVAEAAQRLCDNAGGLTLTNSHAWANVEKRDADDLRVALGKLPQNQPEQ